MRKNENENYFQIEKEKEDEAFVAVLGRLYYEQLESFQGTLIFNPPQLKKFLFTVEVMKNLVDEYKGKVYLLI